MQIVLASSSRYRRALLERLGLPFTSVAPRVDEAPLANETPQATAERLARAKALAIAPGFPAALVIGCDQVAVLDGRILDKPGDRDNALRQLRALSGKRAVFHTALCLHNSATGQSCTRTVPCAVAFRRLDDAKILRYLEREQPYDCAGSAKAEGLGIALIEKIECEDPTALIGLPLIALVDLLAEQGFDVP